MSKQNNISCKHNKGYSLHVRMCVVMLFFFFASFTTIAQDLHFSQFMFSPLSTNPANAGFIPDADYRLGANYRNQYSEVMTQPYKTYSVYGDAQVMREQLTSGWIGLGAVLLSDVAGSGALTSNKAYASLAYHQMLGQSSLLSAGFNLGWVSKSINTANLKFPDQFDGRFFDNNLPTSVQLQNTSINYFDLQAGINYAYFPTDDIYLNAGYSIHHVNRAKESFFASSINERIPQRHIGFAQASIKCNDRLILHPSVYYTNQRQSSSLLFGTIGNINLSERGERQLLVGTYYRWNESIIPMVGFELHHFQFLFNYDVTLSGLKQYNMGRGAAEISITKKGFYGNPDVKQVICPSF